jgi:hypothetical protein
MLTRICLGLALLAAMPAWSQVEPSATGAPTSPDAMQTPPPVSGGSFPTETGSEARSNYLSVGVSASVAYDNDVLENGSLTPQSEFNYSIRPTIAFDQSTPRTHRMFSYSPSFTIYQDNGARNEFDQSASGNFAYRLSPHSELTMRDSFERTTNVFNQPYPEVSGSTQSPTEAVIAPFAQRLGNAADVELSYQFSPNGMIGGGGITTVENYPNPAQAVGLTNSKSYGASAFYNLRLGATQYMGLIYQHSVENSSSTGISSNTNSDTAYFFYTVYLKHTLSISASGGPQHFEVTEVPLAQSSAWTPAITASMGWQRSRTNFAVSYSRSVSGAGGLLGAFTSTNANGMARWQMSRSWTAGVGATYGIQNSVLPTLFALNPGGHTISGSASVQHRISERFAAQIGYTRLHQSYSGLSVISQYPDNNSEYGGISYQFARPLGR